MLAELGKFWRDLVTEDDAGTTYCPVRIFAVSFVALFHVGVLWQFLVHGSFDPVAYSTGAGALLVSIGGAIGAKHLMGADVSTQVKGTQ